MMLEHKVPSLMAGIALEKASTTVPSTAKSLVKLLPLQTTHENHNTIPVENGAPHLNGTASNGVH